MPTASCDQRKQVGLKTAATALETLHLLARVSGIDAQSERQQSLLQLAHFFLERAHLSNQLGRKGFSHLHRDMNHFQWDGNQPVEEVAVTSGFFPIPIV